MGLFHSTVPEVIIGVVFVYLLLSMPCTSANEHLAALTRRGKMLRKGIRQLLEKQPVQGGGDRDELLEKFYKHPPIASLKHDKNHPAHIAPRTFVAVVTDLLTAAKPGPVEFADLENGPKELADGNVKKSFLALVACVVLFVVTSSAYGQQVTLYEHSNFEGRSRSFGIGSVPLSDFNDLASSIKVPPGLVIIVYEHAGERGGYGRWVDLLEDQPVLANLDFNDKISYVTVFSTNRPGFFYARNQIVNGNFVPGHWEGVRRSGIPAIPPPLVGPPIPPTPPPPAEDIPIGPHTRLQVVNGNTSIIAIALQSDPQEVLWNDVEYQEAGVIGSDYRGPKKIGSAGFRRYSYRNIPSDAMNFWYPQKRRAGPQVPPDREDYIKHTLSGIVSAEVRPYIVNIPDLYRSSDLMIHLTPLEKYSYLISESHKPQKWGWEPPASILAMERETPYGNCNEPFVFVEAEIDTDPRAKQLLLSMLLPRIGKRISVYGPWVYNRAHCHQPEIRPAEQIWWSEDLASGTRKHYLNLFCDSSERFWWRGQMGDGTKLEPWGAPPIKGTFAFSFESELGGNTPIFEVAVQERNVVQNMGDSRIVHNLVFKDKTLVSVVAANAPYLKVTYEQVALKRATRNVVRGFVVIEATVGRVTQLRTKLNLPTFPPSVLEIPMGTDPNDAQRVPEKYEQNVFKKEAGHLMFTVSRTTRR